MTRGSWLGVGETGLRVLGDRGEGDEVHAGFLPSPTAPALPDYPSLVLLQLLPLRVAAPTCSSTHDPIPAPSALKPHTV